MTGSDSQQGTRIVYFLNCVSVDAAIGAAVYIGTRL